MSKVSASLSALKNRKLLKQICENLRIQNTERTICQKEKNSLVTPPISPRYDEVYFEGLKWLDSLAGEKIQEGEKDVSFSDQYGNLHLGAAMTFPTDSIQDVVNVWWEKCGKDELKRGALIRAFVPHVDQIPNTLIPVGRKEADEHSKAIIEIAPLRISTPRSKATLPVAALSIPDDELWTAYRSKKRFCLVIGTKQPYVEDVLRRNMPKKLTSPTLLVAPYYGANPDGKRAGYNPELVDRIRHAEYPQFILDYLPIPDSEQSILRLDHIQPVGLHYHAYEHTGFCLSDEAVELILDDWLQWLFYGGLPANSLILDYQKEIIAAYS